MKKAILSLVSLFAFTMSHAQNEAPTAVVKVENDYKPEIVQVSKRGFTPTIENGTEITPLELKFSKGSTPFDRFTSERNIKELLLIYMKNGFIYVVDLFKMVIGKNIRTILETWFLNS